MRCFGSLGTDLDAASAPISMTRMSTDQYTRVGPPPVPTAASLPRPTSPCDAPRCAGLRPDAARRPVRRWHRPPLRRGSAARVALHVGPGARRRLEALDDGGLAVRQRALPAASARAA
eukprot:3319229-Prymnesium_polylepis.1